MPVMMPNKAPDSSMSTLGTVAGGVAGGIFGGPGGAAAGASLGGTAGKMLSGGGGAPQQGVQSSVPQDDAMSRRIQSLQSDPSVQLAQADAALKQMPPEYQQQYGPTIQAARQRDLMGGIA